MTSMTDAVNASRGALSAQVAEMLAALRLFGPRGWLVAAAGSVAALVLIGVPTAMFDNPLFIRMIPIRSQDYAIWAASAVLAGLIAGTFTRPANSGSEGKALSGGFLSYLAVGCPVCNKLVVLLLGTSGALTIFAPAQLFIGLASLALLGWTFRLRARSIAGPCPVQQ
jgi:hypothetical protein